MDFSRGQTISDSDNNDRLRTLATSIRMLMTFTPLVHGKLGRQQGGLGGRPCEFTRECQNVASKRHKRDVKRHKRHLKRSKRHKWSLEQTLDRAAPTTKGASVVESYAYAMRHDCGASLMIMGVGPCGCVGTCTRQPDPKMLQEQVTSTLREVIPLPISACVRDRETVGSRKVTDHEIYA